MEAKFNFAIGDGGVMVCGAVFALWLHGSQLVVTAKLVFLRFVLMVIVDFAE